MVGPKVEHEVVQAKENLKSIPLCRAEQKSKLIPYQNTLNTYLRKLTLMLSSNIKSLKKGAVVNCAEEVAHKSAWAAVKQIQKTRR
jgi:hypothetical protein